MNKDLISYLKEFVTEERLNTFIHVLKYRTRYITVAIEDVYQDQNASAVLRSCDCFGIQDVHIIENRNKYQINSEISIGAEKWLNVYKYDKHDNNSLEAIQYLRKNNYRIIAATPHEDDVLLNDFDIHPGKFALFFGTELNGLSDTVKENADEFLKVPMVGFSESLNISVSAAICIHYFTQKLYNSSLNWKLSQPEIDEKLLSWLRKSIKKVDLIENKFFRS